jgi:hypothetical protein
MLSYILREKFTVSPAKTVSVRYMRIQGVSGETVNILGGGSIDYYLLTLWSRVLLEKLTVNFAPSQEIPRIYGTRKFLTVPTSARHLYGWLFFPLKTPPPPPPPPEIQMGE